MTRDLDLRLLLVLDPTVARDRRLEDLVESALTGGVTSLQVREKNCSNAEFVSLAQRVLAVARRHPVTVLLNDRVDLVKELGADGVHVGQSDLAVAEARRRLGGGFHIGLSVETPAQLPAAEAAAPDYLGVSPVFPTATKAELKTSWGLDGLADLRAKTALPLVAIGGVSAGNASTVMRAGADGLAVVSEICANPAPGTKAAQLRAIIDGELTRRRNGWIDSRGPGL